MLIQIKRSEIYCHGLSIVLIIPPVLFGYEQIGRKTRFLLALTYKKKAAKDRTLVAIVLSS